jgi:hypothetical protein
VRVVLDTNVVVSAAFFGGPPRRVVDTWISGQLQVVVSPSIFDEYLRVCDRLGASYPGTDYQPLLTTLLAHGLHLVQQRAPSSVVHGPAGFARLQLDKARSSNRLLGRTRFYSQRRTRRL